MNVDDFEDELSGEAGKMYDKFRDGTVEIGTRKFWANLKLIRRKSPAGQEPVQANGMPPVPASWLDRNLTITPVLILLLAFAAYTFWYVLKAGGSSGHVVEATLENEKVKLPVSGSGPVGNGDFDGLDVERSLYELEKGKYKNFRGWVFIKTPVGRMYKLILGSGVFIYIDASSRIRFHFPLGSKGRAVHVDEGQVCLQVMPYLGQDFTLYTKNQVIRADTAFFNINTYLKPEEAVSVLSGQVSLSLAGDSLSGKTFLFAGQEINWRPQTGLSGMVKFDKDELTGWYQRGRRLFNEAPLSKLCQSAGYWYGVDIVIDTIVANTPVTWYLDQKQSCGVFRDKLGEDAGIVLETMKNGRIFIRAKR